MIDLVNQVFTKIRNAVSISDLELIVIENPLLNKNKIDELSFPQLKFKITTEDINSLKQRNIITEENTFSKDLSSKNLDPLIKLLYAISWKNGDLKKVKHIIEGIIDVGSKDDKNNGLVFYQFGKYLTQTPGEPIIDQHVIRAYGIYQDKTKFKELHNLSIITKKEKPIIDSYKKWLVSSEISSELRDIEGYAYHIDKVLFALGRTIKKAK